LERGEVGQNYILGGQDVSLAEMLATIARQVGRRPPTIRVPQAPLVPLAWANEQCAKLFGYQPFLTLDGLRMSGHHMFYSSAKAETALGYRARPHEKAIADAINWFREAGMIS
jgi:dihydroflavonol-4-reductase